MVRARALSLSLLAALVLATGAAPALAHAPDSLRNALTRERFYFLMPDRFANGDPGNDLGGLSSPREVTGYDPTHKGWYHGGDLSTSSPTTPPT